MNKQMLPYYATADTVIDVYSEAAKIGLPMPPIPPIVQALLTLRELERNGRITISLTGGDS